MKKFIDDHRDQTKLNYFGILIFGLTFTVHDKNLKKKANEKYNNTQRSSIFNIFIFGQEIFYNCINSNQSNFIDTL